MFLVQDSSQSRENRIKRFLDEDPTLSALLAVIHFEWTAKRAIIALGTSPNVVIRSRFRACTGLERYKDLWKDEVFPKIGKRLPEVIENWQGLGRSFSLRHRLVHGVSSCGSEYAMVRANWAIDAANDIRAVCDERKVNLDLRLPVRRNASS
jgi:hypothetical protein